MTLENIPPLPDFELRKCPLEALPGYAEDNLETAAQAWAFSCDYLLSLPQETPFLFGIQGSTWHKVAQKFYQEKRSFKDYLKTFFEAYEIKPLSPCSRLFTGYYEPELKGARHPGAQYAYPVYGRPSELILIEDLGVFRESLRGHRLAGFPEKGTLIPAFTRQEIEEGALKGEGLELCWVKDAVDLYFMHVQGGGKILFEEGEWMRLGYDGTNGHAYTSLGQEMIKRGLLSPEEASMEKIKEILRAWGEEERNQLLYLNASYVFFKELQEKKGPLGRIGKPLTPFRSLAVDPRALSLGMPLWISTPRLSGFMTAQDVGGAIKGLIRGDIFCGTGEEAGSFAGTLKEEGNLFVLLPSSFC